MGGERRERVFLVGFMGSGKTTVGRYLARQLGWTFLDLDREIEVEAELSIPDIFERFGEQGFREREHEELQKTAVRSQVVVATGGGAFTFERNVEVMLHSGVTVWLDLSFDGVLARLERSPHVRPLFQDEEQTRALFESRLDWYKRADFRTEVSSEDRPGRVARRILSEVFLSKENLCAT